MYILKKEDLKKALNCWSKEFEVYAPQNSDGQIMLLPYEEYMLTMDYINFAFPVKEYLFKQKEKLFSWENVNGIINVASPSTSDINKKVFFGLRACDTYGIKYMDKFFLGGYKDELYEINRESSYIVAVNCKTAGENCFCSSMGIGPFSDEGYDLLFTEFENEYLVEFGSSKGEELLNLINDILFSAEEYHINQKGNLEKEVISKFRTGINRDNIKKLLEENFENPVWQRLAKECTGCTGCSSLCPTCTCFHVVEENTESSGSRVRYWDSCQSGAFTRNAGEHNPRNSEARVRYRFFDKFKYIEDKFDMKGCTGCGRCIGVCPAGINVVNVINDLVEKNEHDAHHDHEKCENVYVPQIAVITEIIEETKKIKRFVMQYENKSLHDKFEFKGQFFEITVFGVGEIAISIPFSSSLKDSFEFCIKKAGKVTEAIHNMKVGDKVGLRGPFGKGFPYENFKGRDIIIVGSGVGLAPVRTMILSILENKQDFGKLVIIASAMTYEDLIYKEDLISWSMMDGVKVLYALNSPTNNVDAHVGVINDLLPDLNLDWQNTASIICASPRRIKALAKDLLKLGMKGTDIFTSLETHMRCGIGKCGHCKVGSKYMCIDGPVFNYEEMLELPEEF